ncbi:hypothetical protein HH654_004866 [Escherichia coli]|nr:hypothetical protein [Escherichia coli]TJH91392.1 hypothetical protein C9146_18810 [Escherichia coli]TJI01334.1 hypothetical protein C9145_19775 [Escherichia coli]TJQ91948.1 hypothetical protein C9Z52_19170 [Escherichia coli]
MPTLTVIKHFDVIKNITAGFSPAAFRKILSDNCVKKEQMVVSAIASTPEFTAFQIITINSEQTFELCALLTKRPFLHFHRIIIHY